MVKRRLEWFHLSIVHPPHCALGLTFCTLYGVVTKTKDEWWIQESELQVTLYFYSFLAYYFIYLSIRTGDLEKVELPI